MPSPSRPSLRLRLSAAVLALTLVGVPAMAPALVAAQTVAPEVRGEDPLRSVQVALNLLLDSYAHPLEASSLLASAWSGVRELAGTVPVEAGPFPVDRAGAWAEFQRRFGLVAAGADPAAAMGLAHAANRAMARAVADCHTHFEESFEKERQSVAASETYGGIGASVLDANQFDPPAPGPVVTYLIDGAPAAGAGLQPGDALLAVDGVPTTGVTSNRIVELVRGTPGTPVRLLLDRPGALGLVELMVERSLVELTLVESRVLPTVTGQSPVGYVKFRAFAPPAERALLQALERLRAEGARAWVLDLRENGGGDLNTFTHVASLFIHEGALAVTTDRGGVESALAAETRRYRDDLQPLALLVDRHTASAAELLTADLQEYGVARVFGATTAGCFGTSQLFRLPDGSALWLTVRSLQSGLDHRDVHQVGVPPDEAVTRTRADLAQGADPALDHALAWLRGDVIAAEGAAG